MASPGRRRRYRYAFTSGRSNPKPRLPPRFSKTKHVPPVRLRPFDGKNAVKPIFCAVFSLYHTWPPGLAPAPSGATDQGPVVMAVRTTSRTTRPASEGAPSGLPQCPYLPHPLSKKRAIREALSLDLHGGRVRIPSLRGDPATFTRRSSRLSPLGRRDHRSLRHRFTGSVVPHERPEADGGADEHG